MGALPGGRVIQTDLDHPASSFQRLGAAAWNPDKVAHVSGISRDELVRRLAEVSHLSYVRQKNRDHGVPLEELSLEVNDHDRERAADIVAELERLGVFQPGAAAPEPHDAPPVQPEPPPPAESRRHQITDIWGNPIGARKRRGR